MYKNNENEFICMWPYTLVHDWLNNYPVGNQENTKEKK